MITTKFGQVKQKLTRWPKRKAKKMEKLLEVVKFIGSAFFMTVAVNCAVSQYPNNTYVLAGFVTISFAFLYIFNRK